MEPHRLGMLLFISSEAFFFGALLITYLIHRTGPGAEMTALFNLPLTTLFSVALFASSGTLLLGDRRYARGDLAGLRRWLLVTVVLGLIFLGGQTFEYRELLLRRIDLATGIFPSIFFTLTGFHGLHVLGGLAALVILWAVAGTRAFAARGGPAVDAISLYWHFVDVVWVFIFSLVYLWTLVE